MKRLLLLIPILAMCGCSTIQENATEPNARNAAEWVRNRSGFIENAVSAITHVAVYASEKDSSERLNTLLAMNAISGYINATISGGNPDSEAIRAALKINEAYFKPILESITALAKAELNNFQKNGYAEFAVEISKAVTAGIRDGSVE